MGKFLRSDKINLFRQQAQQAQRTSVLGEIVLVRPVSFGFLTVAAVCMALALAALFAFGTYTRRTTVEGVVTPNTGLVKVYVQQAGIVLAKRVVEGQRVARGAVLYTVSNDLQSAAEGRTQAALIEQARQRKQSLLQEIDKTRVLQQTERETLQSKIASQRGALTGIDEQIESQRVRTSLAADGAARYDRLLAQDYISKEDRKSVV